jgi:hypothetical protein
MQAVSMSCSVLIIAGYFFIRSVDKELDRISLRLLVETCVANLVFGVSQLLLNSEYALNSYKKCDAVMSFFIVSDVAASLLMTCIAINLLLVIVFRTQLKLSMKSLELCYTLGSVSISVFTAITPFFSPKLIYSYSDELKQCWFTSSDPPTLSQTLWQLWLFHLWPMIGVITTLVCFGIVLIKLRREEIRIDDNLNAVQTSTDKWSGLDDAKAGKDNDSVEQAIESIPQPIKRQGSHMSENSNLLKFFLPRRWTSKRNSKMHEAAHDAVTHNRHVSYVGKTIRQVICYSLGKLYLIFCNGLIVILFRSECADEYFVVLIVTQIFNFATFVDITASNRHQPVYYFISYISTALRGMCQRMQTYKLIDEGGCLT